MSDTDLILSLFSIFIHWINYVCKTKKNQENNPWGHEKMLIGSDVSQNTIISNLLLEKIFPNSLKIWKKNFYCIKKTLQKDTVYNEHIVYVLITLDSRGLTDWWIIIVTAIIKFFSFWVHLLIDVMDTIYLDTRLDICFETAWIYFQWPATFSSENNRYQTLL